MTRLGSLLRSFRSRVYKRDIKPNLGKPEKLAKIPKQFRTIILNQEHWDSFVAYTQSDKFKGSSEARKEARAKSIYNHRLGRGGYAGLEEQMVANNEVDRDAPPSRCLKVANNEDEVVKSVGDRLLENEIKIKDGELKVDQGEDALTLEFGLEKRGCVRGVGTGVKSSVYLHGARRVRGSTKEQVRELQLQLQSEREEKEKEKQEREKQAVELKLLKDALAKQQADMDALRALITGQPNQPQAAPDSTVIENQSSGSAHEKQSPTHSSGSQKNQTTKGNETGPVNKSPAVLKRKQKSHEKDNKDSKTAKKNAEYKSSFVPKVQTIKCRLGNVSKHKIVALGTIYLSDGPQECHNVPVQDDCYRVSIDKSIHDAAFLPHEVAGMKTVGEAVGTFVPWPKEYCVIDDDHQQTENQQVIDITPETATKHVDGQQQNPPKDSKAKKATKFIKPGSIKPKLTRSSTNTAGGRGL